VQATILSFDFSCLQSRPLKLGVIHVEAAFQPRLNGYYVGATSRGWKATPTEN
jgi:hypothetical protein